MHEAGGDPLRAGAGHVGRHPLQKRHRARPPRPRARLGHVGARRNGPAGAAAGRYPGDRRGAGSCRCGCGSGSAAPAPTTRVGDGSSLRASSSPVSIRLKVFEVSTPSASSIEVASSSRTPPLRVSRPSPPRDQGVRPVPLVPRSSSLPSASRGAARTGSRDRRRAAGCTLGTGGRGSAAPGAAQAARQWLEAAEMMQPLLVGQAVQADPRRPALVAIAQDELREFGRRDLIVEALAEIAMAGRGLVAQPGFRQFAAHRAIFLQAEVCPELALRWASGRRCRACSLVSCRGRNPRAHPGAFLAGTP